MGYEYYHTMKNELTKTLENAQRNRTLFVLTDNIPIDEKGYITAGSIVEIFEWSFCTVDGDEEDGSNIQLELLLFELQVNSSWDYKRLTSIKLSAEEFERLFHRDETLRKYQKRLHLLAIADVPTILFLTVGLAVVISIATLQVWLQALVAALVILTGFVLIYRWVVFPKKVNEYRRKWQK